MKLIQAVWKESQAGGEICDQCIADFTKLTAAWT